MAIMPGADYRPLGLQTQAKMRRYDILCLHTMAGTLAGTDRLFKQNGYAGTESHFGVGGKGELVQWQDTANTADANLNGNPRIISVETEDTGGVFPKWTGSDVPAWTEAQLETLARIALWAHRTHGIPLVVLTDAKPGSRGVGGHRQGVDGNGVGYRVPGAEVWSTARGKVCPGDRRFAQIPEVVARAIALRDGTAPVAVVLPATPAPVPVVASSPAPAPAPMGLVAPAFPLPSGSYFGPKSGPASSVSGYYSHREDLRRWQARMVERGWRMAVDGLYGDEVARVARAFQAEKGLGVDGLVGPSTWAAAWTVAVS